VNIPQHDRAKSCLYLTYLVGTSSNVGGKVMPRGFAVFRLMVSSNFQLLDRQIGWSTPFNILWT
jgi:hypothetical protein